MPTEGLGEKEVATAVTSRVLPAPVEEVWALLGDFNGWPRSLSRIETSTLEGGTGRGPVGSVRVLALAGGSSIRERLTSYDDAGHHLAYEFDGPSPFAARFYRGRVQLFELTETGETFAYWTGLFDCDAKDEAGLNQVFCRTYGAFLDDLAAHLKQ
jgi:hypothetical protein